jgi:hypothetical protein
MMCSVRLDMSVTRAVAILWAEDGRRWRAAGVCGLAVPVQRSEGLLRLGRYGVGHAPRRTQRVGDAGVRVVDGSVAVGMRCLRLEDRSVPRICRVLRCRSRVWCWAGPGRRSGGTFTLLNVLKMEMLVSTCSKKLSRRRAWERRGRLTSRAKPGGTNTI